MWSASPGSRHSIPKARTSFLRTTLALTYIKLEMSNKLFLGVWLPRGESCLVVVVNVCHARAATMTGLEPSQPFRTLLCNLEAPAAQSRGGGTLEVLQSNS